MFPCAFPDCRNQAKAKGLCAAHRRQQKLGQELRPLRTPYSERPKVCTFDGCERPVAGRGLCSSHHSQLKAHPDRPLHAIGDKEAKSASAKAAWAKLTPEQREARMSWARKPRGPRSEEYRRRLSESIRLANALKGGLDLPERACRTCGDVFKPNSGSHAYCTKDCYNIQLRARNYGMQVGEYLQMLKAQGGSCALCGSVANGYTRGQSLHIDHCHVTGRVRGLLCGDCNTAIGRFGDDPARLRAAADYLERGQSSVS